MLFHVILAIQHSSESVFMCYEIYQMLDDREVVQERITVLERKVQQVFYV